MNSDPDPGTEQVPSRAEAIAFLRQLSAGKVYLLQQFKRRRCLAQAFEEAGLYLPSHLRPDYPEPVRLDVLQQELSTWASCLEAGCDAEHLRLAREAAGLTVGRAADGLVDRGPSGMSPSTRAEFQALGPGMAVPDHGAFAAACRLLNAAEAGSLLLPPWVLPLLAELYNVRAEYLAAYPLVLSPALQRLRAKQLKKIVTNDRAHVERLLLMVGGVAASTLRDKAPPVPSACSCRGG